MSNIYNILARPPLLEADELYVELEAMAQQLVVSGRFRVGADDRCNFVQFIQMQDNIKAVFSERELFDPALSPYTERIIRQIWSHRLRGEELDQRVKWEMARLKKEVKKWLDITPDMEIKLARAVVQSAHPAVIKLLLWERIEIFVSFSHNIGDLLDIQTWQSAGDNGGMQSTDGHNVSVYISCGGNPFASEEFAQHSGDGFAAMARLMVIGAQELGHYADIMRDEKGRQISRYSADFGGRRAKDHVRTGRLKDIARVDAINAILQDSGMKQIIELERHIRFYEKHRSKSRVLNRTKRKVARLTRKFVKRCVKKGLTFVLHMPQQDRLASHISMMLADMRFNLAPVADVYVGRDDAETEAIACIEALARVPQQAIKWGHPVTRVMMESLYRVYYHEVIPGCAKAYERLSGQPYNMTFTKPKISWGKRLKSLFKRKKT